MPVGHGPRHAHDVFFTREMDGVDWVQAVHFEYIQDIGRQFADIDQAIHARRQDVDGFVGIGVFDHLFDVISQVRAANDDIEPVHFFFGDHERGEFDLKFILQLVLLDVFFLPWPPVRWMKIRRRSIIEYRSYASLLF